MGTHDASCVLMMHQHSHDELASASRRIREDSSDSRWSVIGFASDFHRIRVGFESMSQYQQQIINRPTRLGQAHYIEHRRYLCAGRETLSGIWASAKCAEGYKSIWQTFFELGQGKRSETHQTRFLGFGALLTGLRSSFCCPVPMSTNFCLWYLHGGKPVFGS